MKKKIYTVLLFVAMLTFGLTGYYFSQGLRSFSDFYEAIYATIALCFVNPVSDVNNGYVYAAKALGVVVAASIILSFLKSISAALAHRLVAFHKDSTAVYTDSEYGELAAENLAHGFISTKESGVEKTKCHIVMYEDDEKNINFYSANMNKKGKFYVLLNDMDTTLFGGDFGNNACFFNINEMLARKYWRENSFYEDIKTKKDLKVAIVGCGKVGRAIFKYGFLNNIYALDQHIEYHLWGCTPEDAKFFGSDLATDNDDCVIAHDEDYHFAYDTLKEMDRIIIADIDDKMYVLQQLLYKSNDLNIHIYAGKESSYSFLAAKNVKAFGDIKNILTEDNIKKDNLYRMGKLFNYDYTLSTSGGDSASQTGISEKLEQDMEEAWRKLSGFHKASSLARADHYWIERQLKLDGIPFTDEDFMRMEHLRWDRFHFANHWTYDPVRDNSKRKHHLLVPFDKLSDKDKSKDAVNSKILLDEIERIVQQEMNA